MTVGRIYPVVTQGTFYMAGGLVHSLAGLAGSWFPCWVSQRAGLSRPVWAVQYQAAFGTHGSQIIVRAENISPNTSDKADREYHP